MSICDEINMDKMLIEFNGLKEHLELTVIILFAYKCNT